jgi:predicted GNAT superfamily acetyltransferase
VEIRPLREWEEYRACQDLQEEVWGEDFSEITPASILKIGQRLGGVSSGAFDPGGTLVGFVFGLTGSEDGRPLHWSHMLAVRHERRGRGIGRKLKEHQRAVLLEAGVEEMTWTFDPLVARNAHFNLNRLGVEVVEYVPNMYGETGSRLHRGLGTDRFRVVWDLTAYAPDAEGGEVGAAESGDGAGAGAGEDAPPPGAPASRGPDGSPGPGAPADGPPVVRVEIPADIQEVRREDAGEAREWRERTREGLLPRLSAGYRVAGFVPGPERGFYVLVHPEVEQ